MGDWSLQHTGGGGIESSGLGTTSRGKVVTAHATVNTKGTVVELIAATAYESGGIYLTAHSNTSAASILCDILIGAATESVLIPNVLFCRTNQIHIMSAYFPIRVPKGSRISARTQSNVSGALLYVLAQMIPTGPRMPPPFNRVTAYGVSTTTSLGTAVDAGGTADTKGAFTELVASTTNPIRGAVVAIGPDTDVTTAALCYFSLDVGVGAATEDVVIPDMTIVRETASDQPKPSHFGPYPVIAPAASRITARTQCSVNTAGDRVIQVAVYGLD